MTNQLPPLTQRTRINKFKRNIARGEVQAGMFFFSSSPHMVEICGLAGFDFAVMDLEHSGHDYADVEEQIRAAEAVGLTAFARVREKTPEAVGKVLDSGARGVMLPRTQRLETLIECARASKYAPLGNRGFCPMVRAAYFGIGDALENCRFENDETSVFMLVEDINSVETLAQTLQHEEVKKYVDYVLTGVADLSQSMGLAWDDPRVGEAMARVGQTCNALGVPWGVAELDLTKQAPWMRMGAQILTPAIDYSLFRQACTDLIGNIALLTKEAPTADNFQRLKRTA